MPYLHNGGHVIALSDPLEPRQPQMLQQTNNGPGIKKSVSSLRLFANS